LQDLLSLHLDNNEIEVLEPGAFFGLSKLKALSLQNNKLRTLEHGVFGGLDQLNLLNLNRNLLKSLKPKMFEGAHVLTTILVEDNLIENIETSVLGGLKKQVQLYVNRNPLVCSCALKKEWAVLRGSVVGATCSAQSNLAGSSWDVLQKTNCEPVEVN
jgi:Leucine-rich repeat (LRR) protein